MAYRPEFRDALALLAEATERLRKQGAPLPILVGGGAAEFYTGSHITSGDFDLVTADQDIVEHALEAVGFKRDTNSPHQFLHPTALIAAEVVSGPLMDGRADMRRLQHFVIDNREILITPIEDLIADRMAQALSGPNPNQHMLGEAVTLYRFRAEIDETYLDRRLREETLGEADLAYLRRIAGQPQRS